MSESSGMDRVTCCLADFLHNVYLIAVQHHISPVAASTESLADTIHMRVRWLGLASPHDCILAYAHRYS